MAIFWYIVLFVCLIMFCVNAWLSYKGSKTIFSFSFLGVKISNEIQPSKKEKTHMSRQEDVSK